jgi:hypothetical protein
MSVKRRGQPVANSYCERVFKDCRLQTCYVQSPAYPGIYPRNLHCKYYLNTRLPFIKLYIENEEFNIDGQRCENIMTCPMRPISASDCPYDYLRVCLNIYLFCKYNMRIQYIIFLKEPTKLH